MSYKPSAWGAIRNMDSLEDMNALMDKWDILSKNLKGRPLGLPIVLPDIFLISDSGTGRTTFLSLLAGYLMNKPNLMDFYGDVEFFEFMLDYCPPQSGFGEIERFQRAVNAAKGFRNEYRGIVFVDLDEWVDHFEEKHFKAFMEYISDNSDEWMVVLSVSRGDNEKLAAFEAFISSYIRIEKVIIKRPTNEAFMEYLQGKLRAYGLELEEDAYKIVLNTIGVLCNDRYFDGYKTVRLLCEDIVYNVYTSGTDISKTLSARDVSVFASDGEYVKRFLAKMNRVSKIGF